MKRLCIMAVLALAGLAWGEATNAPSASGDFATKTFVLKYAKADEVATALNDLCRQLGVKQAAVAFPESHTVAIAADPKVVESCAKIVAEVDRKPKQVYVEARFLDLLVADRESLGVTWAMLNNLTLNGAAQVGFQGNRLNNGSSWNQGDETGLVPSPGVASGIATYQGTLSASELSIVLNAIHANNDNRMFANPRVVVASGKTATVDITTKRPNVIISAKRTTGNGNNNFDVDSKIQVIPGKDKLMFADESFFWWGIGLKVEPYVAEDGIITARIVPNVSSLSDVTVQSEGPYVVASAKADGEELPASKFPIIDVKRIETEFSLKSGETAVIGGLSKTEFVELETGIPYLWKIPLIGKYLFGATERTRRQREIVVLVTMGLVDPEKPEKAAGLPKNAFISREYVNGNKKEPGDHTREELIRMYRQDEKPNAEK